MKIGAWSYSSLTSFETCPRRHAITKIHKIIQEPQTQATIHGNEVHKALELYGKGKQEMPEKYLEHKPIVDILVRAPGEKKFETKFALTRDLKPTSFFADDCWVRGVLDVQTINGNTATVLDYKTGKPKTDGDQLRLFAAATFASNPEVEVAHTGYIWLAYNLLDKATYTRDQADEIWEGFRVRVQRLENAIKYDEFPPKPSGLCRNWCPVPKRLCEFSGKV